MRGFRKLFTAAVAVVLVIVPGTSAYATESAPGGRILYVEGRGAEGEAYLKSVRASGQGGQDTGRRVTWWRSPDYSPDGTRIAYINESSVHTMAADGTDDRWLVDGHLAPSYPRWSPDGQSILVERGSDIWSVNKDGHAFGWTNLTGAHEVGDSVASWAPDGRRFATTTYNDVRVYTADGTQVRQVIPLDGAYGLDWNPERNQLAVGAQGDLWLVDLGSGRVRRLTNTPDIIEISPVWSPDGRWLAYGRDEPGVTPAIWLMDRTGGHRHSLGISGTPTSWRAAG